MKSGKRIGLVASWLLVGVVATSAASLVLPGYYGNKEGCQYLATGQIDSEFFQALTRDGLQSYGMGCTFVDVSADGDGNQRADAICSHEGEEAMSAEDFVISPGMAGMTVYTAQGDIWGELEACT